MRIFYAADASPNSAFKSNLWRHNLYSPLVDLGHEVVEFAYDLAETFRNLNPDDPGRRAFILRNRPKVAHELVRQIKAAHKIKPVDLFFSYFYDACVFPEAIDEIRHLGIKTVNWYCNGSYQLHLVKEISPHYDWCLVPEEFRIKDYLAMGARPIYCQEAANPNVYKPHDVPVEFDVTFVGQCYGDRPIAIRRLLDEGINVRVWGHGWRERFAEDVGAVRRWWRTGLKLFTREGQQAVRRRASRLFDDRGMAKSRAESQTVALPADRLGGVLSDEEMIKMYSRSRINLGFSACGENQPSGDRILQIRLRDFEVPMSGGFYVVEYMEELERFFEVGKEIVCYTGLQDLTDKIKYYLQHDREREAIRRAGYERCLRDHTWHKRFQMVFREMGLS